MAGQGHRGAVQREGCGLLTSNEAAPYHDGHVSIYDAVLEARRVLDRPHRQDLGVVTSRDKRTYRLRAHGQHADVVR